MREWLGCLVLIWIKGKVAMATELHRWWCVCMLPRAVKKGRLWAQQVC